MDTRLIEVAIGLVLVFALSGLLVTALHEIWTSLRKSRGDTLLLGVCSLVGDNQVTMGSARRMMFKGSRPSAFTDALLAHPLLLSQVLGDAQDQRRPSYLPSDVFVSGLLAHLNDLYTQGQRPDTPQLWINALVTGPAAAVAAGGAATSQAPQALVKALAALADGTHGDWVAYEKRLCAWYDAVMARAGGWFRRDTQLRLFGLGLLVAVAGNINPLVIAPRLWNDPVLRSSVTAAAIEAGKIYAEQTAAPGTAASASSPAAVEPTPAASAAKPTQPVPPARSLLPQSREVEQALAALKERLFATIASRTSSAAVANQAQAVASLLIDLQEHVQDRRQGYAQADYPKAVFDASVVIERHAKALVTQLESHKDLAAMAKRLAAALRDERDALLPATAGHIRPIGARACTGADSAAARAMCEPLDDLQALAGIGLPIGWDWDNWPGCNAACQARHQLQYQNGPSASDGYAQLMLRPDNEPVEAQALRAAYFEARKTLYAAEGMKPGVPLWRDPDVLSSAMLQAVVGWITLAIAATLGAPFWFDMLGRLVKLRGAGAPSGSDTLAAKDGNPPPATTLAPPTVPPDPSPAPVGSATGAVTPAEQSLGSAQISQLQNQLILLGHLAAGMGTSGRFDNTTRNAILAWQAARNQNTSGELTQAEIDVLLPPPAPPVAAPPAMVVGRTPLRTNGTINVLTETEVRTLYGDIGTIPNPAGAGLVQVVTQGQPGQTQRVLVPLVDPKRPLLPVLAGLQVHAKALPHFLAVFADIHAQGLDHLIISCAGTLCERHMDHNPQRPLSRHTWGIAIDINSAQNAYGTVPAAIGAQGSVRALVPIFAQYGFAWGGDFTTGADGMHFELALRVP